MATISRSKSAEVHARLGHPVIDSDGHTVEFEPGFLDVLRTVGGPAIVERYLALREGRGWYRLTPEEGKLDHLWVGGGLVDPSREDPAMLDEFAACGIERAEDIHDLFVPRFYFGCEADDRLNALAFATKINPFGARLRAIMSSDIGHWDVPDMTAVLEEAWELVEDGVMTEEDFREFTFVNPTRLWTALNPDFFKGTVVEGAVRRSA